MTRNRLHREHPTYRGQAGLTLVELMVATLLAVILSGGLFYMTSNQQEGYEHQLKMMTSNEHLWGSMEYLQRRLRQAGYGFAGCPSSPSTGHHSPVVMVWDQQPTCEAGPCVKPSQMEAVRVHNNKNLLTGLADGTDSLSVTHALDDSTQAVVGTRLQIMAPDPDSPILLLSSALNIKAGDLLVLWENNSSSHCTALKATTDPQQMSPDQFAVQYGDSPPYNPPNANHYYPFPVNGYPAGTLVRRLGRATESFTHHFAVDNSVPHRPPRLVNWSLADKSDLQILAVGIEDMQLAWACDTDGDGKIKEGKTNTGRKTDEWAFNVAGDTLPACSSNFPIQAVRLTLISRSRGSVTDGKGYRPAAEDRAAGSPTDDQLLTHGSGTFSRSTHSTIVDLRNVVMRTR